jgi:Peptidase family C25
VNARAAGRRSRLLVVLLGAILVGGVAAATEAANPAAEQTLLSHVPTEISGTCTSVEPGQNAWVAQVACKPGGDVAEADYLLFSDNDTMDSTFQGHVSQFPEATGTDCSTGPGYGTYTIDSEEAGQLLCATDSSGVVFFEWTDERFGIVTVATSASGSYQSLFDWWANDAGPVESSGGPLPSSEPTAGPPATGAPTPGETTSPPASQAAPTPGASEEPGAGPKALGTPYSRITGASIHQVIFAAGIDPSSSSPVGISDVFKTGTPEIDALIAWDVIDVGAPLDVTLFKGNRLVSTTEVVPNNPAKQAPSIDLDGGFAVPMRPDGGFDAGHYSVELDYHSLPEQVATFDVNDSGDGAPEPGVLGGPPGGSNPDLGPIPYADPSQVLVVTRSSILRQQMGDDTDAVLAAAAKVGTLHDLNTELGNVTRPVPASATIKIVQGLLKAGSYKYLLILGNEDTVPFGHVKLPDSVNYSDEMDPGIPGDYVVSDDPYANLDGDPLQIPDLAVARIPTSDDAQLMLKQLGENQPAPAGAFSIVNEVRRSMADGPLGVVNDITPVTLYYSPPTLTGQVPQTNESRARFIYILLHGSGSVTDTWFGEIQKWTPIDASDPLTEYVHEENDYTHGLSVADAGDPGAFIDVGACFGAYTLDSVVGDTHKTRDNSLALAFLADGARAFVADTYISESYNVDPGETPVARTGWEILLWQAIQGGATPIDAFFSAKAQYGEQIKALYASGSSDDSLTADTNFLALHEMAYLGRP